MSDIGRQLYKINGKKQSCNTFIFYLAMLLVFVINQNPDWANKFFWWGSVVFLCVSFFVAYKSVFQIKQNYILWLGVFLIFALLSFAWAVNVARVGSEVRSFFLIVIILFFIGSSIKTEKDIENVLIVMLISIIINLVWLFFTNRSYFDSVAIQSDTNDRFGNEGLWNSNSIGMMSAIAMYISLYFYKKVKEKSIRLIYFIIIALMIFVALISGSRKATLMVLLGLCGYLFLTSKGKRGYAVLIIYLLVLAFYYVVMEIPFFYSIVGNRIDSLLSSFTGNGLTDSSAEHREKYITDALHVWKDYPIFGCGLGCYRELNSVVKGMYSHNNYTELLANLGLIGTAIYYSAYLYCFIRLFKIKKKNNLVWLMLMTLSIFTIMDFGCVSYNLLLNQVFIMLMFSLVSIYPKQ